MYYILCHGWCGIGDSWIFSRRYDSSLMLHFPASMFVCESVPLPTETMFQAFDANNGTNCLQLIQNRMQNVAIKSLDTFQYRNVNHPKRVRTPRVQLSRIQFSPTEPFFPWNFFGSLCVTLFLQVMNCSSHHLHLIWKVDGFPTPKKVAMCKWIW